MCKSLITIIQIILLAIPLSQASAEFNEPHIIVFGSAETEVVPDKLLWNISIKNTGATLTAVAKEHAVDVAEVLSYLTKSGIPNKNVKTSRMQLMENYVYRSNSRIKEGYYAQTHINFETADFSKYLEYWKKLSSFPHLAISGVSFKVTNYLEIQNKTRITAAHNAREKATDLATAMGATINKTLLIEEIPSSSQLPRNRAATMEMAGMTKGATPISPGEETVRAKIKIVFELIPAK